MDTLGVSHGVGGVVARRAEGVWHHVVNVWDGATMRIYVGRGPPLGLQLRHRRRGRDPHRLRTERARDGSQWHERDRRLGLLEDHPLLQLHEPRVQLFCNETLTKDQALGVLAEVEDVLGGWRSPFDVLNGHGVASWLDLAGSGSFSLGHFPVRMYQRVHAYLEREGVSLSRVYPLPEKVERPRLLVVDGTDFIVADDFEVDVPEVVHRPEYFVPRHAIRR